MGEIVEMMLEGELCEGCGVYMPNAQGFPQRCRSCRDDRGIAPFERVPCPACGKRVKFAGLADHKRAAHGDAK